MENQPHIKPAELPLEQPYIEESIGSVVVSDAVAKPTGFDSYEETLDENGYGLADTTIDPVDADAVLSAAEIVDRIETDHAVKRAPEFTALVADAKNRTNEVTYIAGYSDSLHTHTSDPEYVSNRVTVTEGDALRSFDEFLDIMIDTRNVIGDNYAAANAEDFKENLTFIGEKEYLEAIEGIATYWKAYLDSHPDKQIFVLTGEIGKIESYEGQVKSDEFMLDNILKHFTDEELDQYGSRFTLEESELTSNPADVKVVALDDWTITGSQLIKASTMFMARKPTYKGSLEVQLVAATEARIKKGLKTGDTNPYGANDIRLVMPVRSYYVAHDSEEAYMSRISKTNPDAGAGGLITGFDSSVDYGFEVPIAGMVQLYNHEKLSDEKMTTPPLMNIVRPYRNAKLERLDTLRAMALARQAREVSHV